MSSTEPNAGSRWVRLLMLLFFSSLLHAPAQTGAQPPDAPTIEQQVMAALCDKQVVLLGELPSHGEAQAFQAKARIVERLVTRCDFDAVLFEAPIYDFLGFHKAVAEDRAVPAQLDKAIGGFWLSRGLRDWREWLFAQATDGQLVLGGLDDQVSATSDYARATLPNLVAVSVPARSAAECQQAVERNLFWRYDANHAFDEAEQVRLRLCSHLAAEKAANRAYGNVDPNQQLMLENLANLYSRQESPDIARDRDEMMYRNLRWQSRRMPYDSKFIVWTATVHAARRQGARKSRPLGAWLSEQWGDRLAAIGFCAFGGQSSRAGMPSKTIPDAAPDSLEARTTQADTPQIYLDKPVLHGLGIVPSRLLGRTVAADWSTYFDGVVVIREEFAPDFEPR